MSARLTRGLLLLTVPLLWGFEPFRTGNDDVEQGNAALSQGQVEQALEHYDRAAEELPANPGVHYNRGIALQRLKRLDEAREALIKGTTATDGGLKSKSFYNLGNVLYEQEQHKEAADAYRRALRLRPDHFPSKWNLELALRRIQEEEKQQQQKKDKDDQEQQQNKDDQKQQKKDNEDQQKNQDGKQDPQGEKQPKPGDDQQDQEQQPERDQQGKQQDPQRGPQDRPKPSPSKQQMDAVLDALDRNDKNLQRRRARMHGRGLRRPQKDW